MEYNHMQQDIIKRAYAVLQADEEAEVAPSKPRRVTLRRGHDRIDMVAPIKQVVTVKPGGIIELRSDQLRPGSQARVTVEPFEEPFPEKRTWADFIGSGKGAFKSVQEIDDYIREIRDWGGINQ